jgi:hypothetical protein
MIHRFIRICALIAVFCTLNMAAQELASSLQDVVPPLINFSGVLSDVNSKPLTGVVGVTFSLYKDSQGGTPLWMETQNLQPSKNGHYTVTLGSADGHGLPADLFVSGEARWLGVQAQGQAEQPRVLLLSVPYALKARDAETLGGKPASAFLTSTNGVGTTTNTGIGALSGSGKKNYVPLWLGATKLGNSNLFQNGSGNLGVATTAPAAALDVNGTSAVRDTLTLFPKGSSPTLTVKGTVFNVSNSGLVSFVAGQTFPGAGTITGVTAGAGLSGGGTKGKVTLSVPNQGITNSMLLNSSLTLNPGGGMSGGGAVSLGGKTTLGLKNCSSNQVLEFISGSWACANAGTGTISGVTAGTDLTGGGTNGNVTLNLDTNKVPQLAAANSFSAAQRITNNAANTDAFTITNNAASGAGMVLNSNSLGLYAAANAIGATGIFGANTANTGNGVGVQGFSVGGTGIYGNTSGTSGLFNGAAAVVGDSKNYWGVWGLSAQADGVHGINGSGGAGVGAESKGKGYGVWAISSNANTYGVGVRGESFGNGYFPNGWGSDGVDGIAHTATGSGVAGVNFSAGVGVYAHSDSGWGVLTDSNVSQTRDKGGWVKAMAFVDPNVPSGIAVTRCFNSQLGGAAASTPPCGISINHIGQGLNLLDFGFQVNDRFVSITGAAAANPLYVTANLSYCTDCSSVNQVETDTFRVDTAENSDAAFTIFIF